MSNDFNQIVEYVASQKEMFLPALTDEKISWEKEKQFAIQVLSKPDGKNKSQICYAGKVALQNPASLQNAIINVAACGITLNPVAKLAYLVPRDGAICLDISYMGLLHIAMQSGSILWGQCKLVYANDTYESNGLDKAPTHKYNAFGDRGVIVGGYCTVKTPEGDYLTDEMSLADIKKVEATSKASGGFSPWKTFWEEMARKTIVKRASKYWPKVERLDNAIHYLNTDAGEGFSEVDIDETVIVSTETLEHLMDLIDSRGGVNDRFYKWLSGCVKRDIGELSQLTEQEALRTIKSLENAK